MKKTLLGTTLTAALIVTASAAFAQEAPPAAGFAHTHDEPPHRDEGRPPRGPAFAVVNDLEQLRRLYAMAGREGDIVAVYHEVLNRSQDPMLRHYVYDSLAREQLKPTNPEPAIATLRTSLAEDLAAAARTPRDMPPAAAQ